MASPSRLLRTVAALALLGAAWAAPSALGAGSAASIASPSSASLAQAAGAARSFAALERQRSATLAVVALDTGSRRSVAYRGDERIPFASANKTFIAAAVLAQGHGADLDVLVHYTRADLLAYAPITSRFVDSGMTVRELLDAMLRFSDNTAANLLVRRLGGPPAVQSFLRGIGDTTTRVDRLEPDLNEATPGDPRDTTTASAFARDLRSVVLGGALDAGPRALLRNTMLDNTTGDAAIRAGVDPAWPVADKTGTGEYGVRNDIAVVYPAGRAPIVLVVLTRHAAPDATADDALVASATRVALRTLLR